MQLNQESMCCFQMNTVPTWFSFLFLWGEWAWGKPSSSSSSMTTCEELICSQARGQWGRVRGGSREAGRHAGKEDGWKPGVSHIWACRVEIQSLLPHVLVHPLGELHVVLFGAMTQALPSCPLHYTSCFALLSLKISWRTFLFLPGLMNSPLCLYTYYASISVVTSCSANRSNLLLSVFSESVDCWTISVGLLCFWTPIFLMETPDWVHGFKKGRKQYLLNHRSSHSEHILK